MLIAVKHLRDKYSGDLVDLCQFLCGFNPLQATGVQEVGFLVSLSNSYE